MQCIYNVVIFVTDWDPPAVARCNLQGSQSVGGLFEQLHRQAVRWS